MYIITMTAGYDDYVDTLFVTSDFDKGSQYVNKQNAHYAALKKKVDPFYKVAYPQWMKDNPLPQSTCDGRKEQWHQKYEEFAHNWFSRNLTHEEWEKYKTYDNNLWAIKPIKVL